MKPTTGLVVMLAIVLAIGFAIAPLAGCSQKASQSTSPKATPTTQGQPAEQGKAAVWTCPMHPEVRESKPGKCPKCGMDLVQTKDEAAKTTK